MDDLEVRSGKHPLPEADAILERRGITVVPDILANSGGVVVSYFEWVQDLQFHFWHKEEVDARLEQVMKRSSDLNLLNLSQGWRI